MRHRATVAAVAAAAALVLAVALGDTSAIGLAGLPVAAVAGVALSHLVPRAAVLAPAAALAASAVPGVIDGVAGRLGVGLAVGLGLAVPGLGHALAPALPLAVLGIGLALGDRIEPAVVAVAVVVGLSGAVVIDRRSGQGPAPPDPHRRDAPSTDDARRLRRQRAARQAVFVVAVAAAVVPLGQAIGPLVPRLDETLPDPDPGSGDAGPSGANDHPGFDGGLDVGDPVDLDDAIVLRVVADEATFWRMATYADYDGRAWADLASTVADLSVAAPGPGAVEVHQAVTVVRPVGGGVPTAYRPIRVDLATGAARFRGDATVAASRTLSPGEIYNASSIRPRTDDATLAGTTVPDSLPADLAALAREDDVTDRVAALARRVTADADDLLGAVRALEDEIEQRVTYTRDIESLPGGAEAVDHLLFESGRGFCEQIGTALVTMARSLGIPARLVVGYVPGERDDVRGEWVVRADDAHAWAEIHFEGVGWVGFDPTAGVPVGPAENPRGAALGRLAAVLAVLGGAGAVAVGAHRVVRRRPERPTPPSEVAAGQLVTRFEALCAALGVPATASSTVLQLGAAAAGRLEAEQAGGPGREVAEVAAALDRLLYCASAPTPEELDALDARLGRLRDEVAATRVPGGATPMLP